MRFIQGARNHPLTESLSVGTHGAFARLRLTFSNRAFVDGQPIGNGESNRASSLRQGAPIASSDEAARSETMSCPSDSKEQGCAEIDPVRRLGRGRSRRMHASNRVSRPHAPPASAVTVARLHPASKSDEPYGGKIRTSRATTPREIFSEQS